MSIFFFLKSIYDDLWQIASIQYEDQENEQDQLGGGTFKFIIVTKTAS